MSVSEQFDVGDRVRCSVAFTNAISGAATDADIQFKVRTPAGVETTYVYGTDPEVVRAGVGSYYSDVTITANGTWAFRFVATGALVAAVERTRRARKSAFADPT